LYRRLIPTLPAQLERRSGRPKRIGVVSRFLFRHAVSFCFGGLFESLAQLENTELYLFPIYESHLSDDPVSRHLEELADSWQPLAMEQPVLVAAQTIQAAQLDLLIYPEIGMDPFSYMLAHSRLATYQAVLAGHPLTSGLSTLDYFITSSELEIPGCESHYTEQWVGLPGLIQYPRPTLPTTHRSRSQLGLPEDRTLYLCPMTLFKIHPDLDACFGEILRSDPQGRIVLFEYLNTPYHLILKQRFEQTMPDVHERILFLPFQSFEGFLQILNQADVVLDTHYFSGGNTSFLAFELGVPVVTLPSEQLKARSTWGLYQRMGLQTGIASDAQDYIEKALLLGQNPDLRQAFSTQILANNSLIFEQTDWNRAFGDWCLQLLNNG
jgi:predicted O-linked N-acetylglucosamine transferase (SPINDLY family)